MIKPLILSLIYMAALSSAFASPQIMAIDAEAAKTTASIAELRNRERSFKAKKGRSTEELADLQKTHPMKRFSHPPLSADLQKDPKLKAQRNLRFIDVYFNATVGLYRAPGEQAGEDLSFFMDGVDQQACMALGRAFLLEGARYEARFKKPWLSSFDSVGNDNHLTLWSERSASGGPTEQNLAAVELPCQRASPSSAGDKIFALFWHGLDSPE